MGAETIMRVENVTRRFGGLVAVDHVSLNVEQGKILGLIGANGAGKTTLFNMMTGMLKVSEGNIYYGTQEITNQSSDQICKMGIARTFQIVKPFTNLTALENVMVGVFAHMKNPKIVREKAEEIIHLVGLTDRMNVDGEYLNLPERKKLELARALATEPKILLLDEVIAGMGTGQAEEIVQLISRINQSGITVVMIEHVMKAVMNLCSYICVLDQGKLIAEGLPEEIANDPVVISSYLGEKNHVAEN